MRSSRSEYSRYYGDFRGVDFSSDHTLVADSRFPYLVNMYKDYAGGGQGIETIPGFRRRFVAPNNQRIHGIHSYKSKDGKRQTLVHAGDALYKWGNFPNESGFAKEIIAVVKEYDEYSSDIEGVGIKDYLKVEFTVIEDYEAIVDVRDIKLIGSKRSTKISIYDKNLNGTYDPYYDGTFISDAYTFTQSGEGSSWTGEGGVWTVTVKIPKVIKDSAGTVVFDADVGDTIKVNYYVFYAATDGDGAGNGSTPTLLDAGTTPNGTRMIELRYVNEIDGQWHQILTWFGWGGQRYSTFSNNSIPKYLSKSVEDINGATEIRDMYNSRYATVSPAYIVSGYTVVLTVFYDGGEAIDAIDLTKCYMRDKSGTKIYLPEAAKNGVEGGRAAYRLPSPSFYEKDVFTALEFDEYADEGKTDYNYVDISGAPELQISEISLDNGNKISPEKYRREGDILLFAKSDLEIGKRVTIQFGNTETTRAFGDMNDRDSTSFVFGEKLYILDGKNYLVYDGEGVSRVVDEAYIPTTYINTIVGGENADAGTKNEPRNILSPLFKNTFVPDGESTEYYLSENNISAVSEVKVYDTVVDATEYEVDLVNGKVKFNTAPKRSEEVEGYPEEYAGVEITAEKGVYPDIGDKPEDGDFRSMINKATIATVFDNRVFFSGIPSKPNFIFWSNLKNPSYIGILNYMPDGIGTSPITAMIPVGNSLLVLKGDAEEGGAVYYHTPVETGIDVMTKSYPSQQGLAGIGCLGAACNFLDDPVFVSRLGLEAIGKLNLSYERSIEHRSSLIDAKLVNLPNLASAKLCEWGGYLVLLVDGKIFLADSRQSYADQTGVLQYEWYYLEDIGVFDEQYKRYEYLHEFPMILMSGDKRADIKVTYQGAEYNIGLISDIRPDAEMIEVSDKIEKVTADVDCNGIEFTISAAMYPENGTYYACLCDTDGEMVGGEFKPAVIVKTIDDNLYFGTENGVVCSFNFDKRGSDGAIPADYYTFDGRAIYSGCALKMDNCGIPHLTKTTVKKSTVVKVKSFMRTAAKIRVRTNKNPFNEIARINGTRFSFDDMDFSDFSFVVGDDTLFAVREKEKKWVEKQYYLYSDEYKKPFALYYLAYRYFVAGKYKG